MEFVYYTVAAVALYFFSDWILERIEAAVGQRLPNRSVFFFAILLGSAVLTFWVIRQFLAPN